MTPDQLRKVLKELTGDRDLTIAFSGMPEHVATLHVHSAMLIPDEPDHMVKVTDGKHIYVLDAERVAYLTIALKKLN
ncbi:MAG: hypothetical protein RBS39_04405 [Phycisphaerales bacterium]|jgi:hypothetical protein|nr:hypothetical protein [Phycisphaerales bacterium]